MWGWSGRRGELIAGGGDSQCEKIVVCVCVCGGGGGGGAPVAAAAAGAGAEIRSVACSRTTHAHAGLVWTQG
jgi:hypothetical protein